MHRIGIRAHSRRGLNSGKNSAVWKEDFQPRMDVPWATTKDMITTKGAKATKETEKGLAAENAESAFLTTNEHNAECIGSGGGLLLSFGSVCFQSVSSVYW